MTRCPRLAGPLLVALVLAACSSSTATSTSPRDSQPVRETVAASTTTTGALPLVAMLGDSNTYRSIPELEAAFREAGLASTIRGIPGSGLKDLARDWLAAARMIAAAPPAVVVVALGTNDAVDGSGVAAFGERLDALLAALGEVPVVWVTHIEHAAQNREPADERAINTEIRAAPSRHPNVTVLDLTPKIEANRDLLDTDALHFSEQGEVWFAEQIAQAAAYAVG